MTKYSKSFLDNPVYNFFDQKSQNPTKLGCVPSNEGMPSRESPFCFLMMQIGGSALGSGELIAPNVVLTCAHNLMENNKKLAQYINISPGYHYRFDPPNPQGTKTVDSSALRVPPRYSESLDPQWDIGLIIIPDSPFKHRSNFRTVTSNNFPKTIFNYGFPAGYNQIIGHPWEDTGSPERFEGNLVFFENLFGAAGSSGSPLHEQGPGVVKEIVGVMTVGAGKYGSCETGGVMLTPEVIDWIRSETGLNPVS